MRGRKLKKLKSVLSMCIVLFMICNMYSQAFADGETTIFMEATAEVMGEEQIGEVSTETKEEKETAEETTTEDSKEEETTEESTIEEATTEISTEDPSGEEPVEENDTESAEEETTEETMEGTEIAEEKRARGGSRSSQNAIYDQNFDTSVLPDVPGNGKNEWQIVKGGYAGVYDGESDVSQSLDQKANVNYSEDNAVRLTKNVISTDTENEFLMYLCVEPQVSWEEVLQLNTIKISNNARPISPPEWPAGGQNSAYFSPTLTGTYKYPVKFQYYATVNGTQITLATVTMYTDVKNVPNGGIGIGNPLLAPEGDSFYAEQKYDRSSGSDVMTVKVDISPIYSKYDFAEKKVCPKKVTDQMGDYIVLQENSAIYDGGTYKYEDGILKWTLPANDLGTLPYVMDKEGNITPEGLKRQLNSGKVTYYRQQSYEMSYHFSLAVGKEDFVSCGSKDSSNDISALYSVQTNLSPESPENKNYGGTVNYETGGKEGKGYFYSPYIKGLLYNIEFKKILEKSDLLLEGITFQIKKIQGDENYSQKIAYESIATTDKEGYVKFHNMPWGEYIITEVEYQEDNSFLTTYLNHSLPLEIAKVSLGEVVNGMALTVDHSGLHGCDQEGDVKNRLYLLQDGIVENKPNRAKVTIVQMTKYYDNLSQQIQKTKLDVKVNSDEIYKKPDEVQSKLSYLTETKSIGHEEVIVYDVLLPTEGGTLKLEEMIPESLRNMICLEDISVSKNTGSSDMGEFVKEENGCSIKILPGNDITITFTNTPEGRVFLKKVIDNYHAELYQDDFIINVNSVEDQSKSVNLQVVLKHEEESPVIRIQKTTQLAISEILPKEYEESGIEISGGGQIQGNLVTVNPGEIVTITVHNTYSGTPFFHVSDAVKNIFKGK